MPWLRCQVYINREHRMPFPTKPFAYCNNLWRKMYLSFSWKKIASVTSQIFRLQFNATMQSNMSSALYWNAFFLPDTLRQSCTIFFTLLSSPGWLSTSISFINTHARPDSQLKVKEAKQDGNRNAIARGAIPVRFENARRNQSKLSNL